MWDARQPRGEVMRTLTPQALACVHGGQDTPPAPIVPGMNVERIKTQHLTVDRVLTDYGYCASTVRESCKAQHGGWLWGTWDSAAAACTLREMPKVCGQPKQDPGPP